MKKFVIIVLFFFVLSSLFSQQVNEKDSLLSLIKVEKNDSLKAEHYYHLGLRYSERTSLETRINTFLIAHSLFKSQPFSPHKAYCMSALGRCYILKKDFRNSEKMYQNAIKEAKKAQNLDVEFDVTIRYLEAFLSYKSPVQGLKTVLELKNKAIKANNKELLFKSYQLKNKHFLISGINIDERKALADTMLSIALELQDSFLIHRAYFELAGVNYSEKSIEYYQKSLDYVDPSDRLTLSSLYNNLSGRYCFLGNFNQALIYADSAYNVSVEVNRNIGVAASLYRKGEAYFFKNDFHNALEYGLKALEAFKAADVLRRQDMSAELISESYKALGNYKKSLEYRELQYKLSDSLEKRNQLEDLKFVEEKFAYELNQKKDSTELALKQLEIKNINDRLEKQKLRQYLLYGGISTFIVLALILFVGFQRKKKDNLLIEKQKKVVEEKNKEITDSILYAKRIQNAILPPNKVVKEYLQESFIYYKPKDIVAGDFYWLEQKDKKILFAAADCTGHGVPGAMVSVICNNGLNRSVREYGITDPGKILDKAREIVVKEFEKSEEDVKDGMDIALCSLEGNTLKYAGAHNPLWIIRSGSNVVEEIKANKQPIGKFDNPEPYKTHSIKLSKGDTIYIFSDGYADQFGGEKGKKMKTTNFKKLLLSIKNESMDKQKEQINRAFEEWKGDLEQLDDVCVIGVRI